MKSHFVNVIISRLQLGVEQDIASTQDISAFVERSSENHENTVRCCNRVVHLTKEEKLENHVVVFIGDENSRTLSNVLMTWSSNKCFSYNPATQTMRLEGVQINRALMKRYYLVEKAKDANIVGIVVGTLGVARYLEVSLLVNISQIK